MNAVIWTLSVHKLSRQRSLKIWVFAHLQASTYCLAENMMQHRPKTAKWCDGGIPGTILNALTHLLALHEIAAGKRILLHAHKYIQCPFSWAHTTNYLTELSLSYCTPS